LAYDYGTNSGIITPDTSETLTNVQNEFKGLFGNDLDITPSTPQGVLITALTLERQETAALCAFIANQFNPSLNSGIYKDAICELTGIQRQQATYTTTYATIEGNGTVNAGAQAQTTAGDIFVLTSTVTLPTTSALFQAQIAGDIPCATNTLTTFLSDYPNVTSLNNPDTAIIGKNTQTDAELEVLRLNTLSNYAVGTLDAIASALFLVKGVQSLQGQENITNTQTTINGISMLPHSIYFCVSGGTDADVARAIYNNRSAGSAFNGNISVPIVSTAGQTINVLFDRPTAIPIFIQITVKLSAGVSQQNIINSIVLKHKPKVGENVSAFEISGEVSQDLGVYVKECLISTSTTFSSNPIVINVNEIGVISESNITVIVV